MPNKPRSGVRRPLWTYFLPRWARMYVYKIRLDRAAKITAPHLTQEQVVALRADWDTRWQGPPR